MHHCVSSILLLYVLEMKLLLSTFYVVWYCNLEV